MRSVVTPHTFSGSFRIPASKSHTIRSLLFASLASGETVLDEPLDSLDARSCVTACRALGASIQEFRDPSPSARLRRWVVRGVGQGASRGGIATPEDVVDVGNSGTTLYLALAVAALGSGQTVFTGDAQIRRRSADNLLRALRGLGATAYSTRNNGCAPIVVGGPWRGGRVSIECPTSQYLSALLLAAPLAPAGVVTEIDVPLLYERPYVEMTLQYLDARGVAYEAAADRSFFRVPGGAQYEPLSGGVPGDFSSAAFPACAAAIAGGPVELTGLNPQDVQGDKAVMDMLASMGCSVEWSPEDASGREGVLRVSRSGPLVGTTLDLNATPDALPALAVTACYAQGETRLVNVANARLKETDRVAVMAAELGKLGADIEELPDGLVIRGHGGLEGGVVDGHDDHRVVMSLAIAGLGAKGPVSIDTAECASVTYPGFFDLIGPDSLPRDLNNSSTGGLRS